MSPCGVGCGPCRIHQSVSHSVPAAVRLSEWEGMGGSGSGLGQRGGIHVAYSYQYLYLRTRFIASDSLTNKDKTQVREKRQDTRHKSRATQTKTRHKSEKVYKTQEDSHANKHTCTSTHAQPHALPTNKHANKKKRKQADAVATKSTVIHS